jgi:hypothetical protein
MRPGATLIAAAALALVVSSAAHADRAAALRVLCAQISGGDFSEPGTMAAFQRCLRSHDAVAAMRRNVPPPRNHRLAAALTSGRHPVALTHGATRLAGPSDACRPGLVWRESTPSDHACVTPAVRAQVRARGR